jgi:hypothetical protein
LDSARYTSRRWHDAFDAAVSACDVEAMAHAHRGLCRDRDMVAKLTGAYAPEKAQLDVVVSTVEATRQRLLAQVERDVPALRTDHRSDQLPVIDAEVEEETA